MNTGIGDAVNLAWKLADVVRARAGAWVLDTYEEERIAFARLLVATTDRAFTLVSGRRVTSQLFRTYLVPHLVPFLMGFSRVRREAFRALSQTLINYRGGALGAGEAGDVHGGDRLPWVASADNFAPLASLDWQLHVYGAASEPLRRFAGERSLPVFAFPWNDDAEAAGLGRDAMYLVRPDSYVGFAAAGHDVAELARFLARVERSS
jgi:2-polyprenyl-6-methoxyphenol hydroxylase-like FAD-dependent oxidoreductase